MMKKKITKKEKPVSYNPFKMWGSWAGAFVGWRLWTSKIMEIISEKIYGFSANEELSKKFMGELLNFNSKSIANIFGNSIDSHLVNLVIFEGIVFALILGFLVGWMIHSLFRCIKNKDYEAFIKEDVNSNIIKRSLIFIFLWSIVILRFLYEKKYSPFNMWGSWVGIILGYLTAQYVYSMFLVVNLLFMGAIGSPSNINFIYSVFGLIIGWAIHSLCRYIKNRRKN